MQGRGVAYTFSDAWLEGIGDYLTPFYFDQKTAKKELSAEQILLTFIGHIMTHILAIVLLLSLF